MEAIESQTVKPHAVILVDNNSTDGSLRIAEEFGFVTILHEKQQGIAYARNKGFDAVKSGIIARIDADTVMPPNWVERVLEYYGDDSNRDQALTGGCFFYNIRMPHFFGWCQSQIAFRANRFILGHYILFGSNMAIPRKLWLAVRPDVCMRNDIHEDLDLSIHLHRLGYLITYQETLKVGLKMKRVRSHHSELWENLMLWPHTLKIHHLKGWVLGWLGAVFLYVISPVGSLMEFTARLFGRKPIKE